MQWGCQSWEVRAPTGTFALAFPCGNSFPASRTHWVIMPHTHGSTTQRSTQLCLPLLCTPISVYTRPPCCFPVLLDSLLLLTQTIRHLSKTVNGKLLPNISNEALLEKHEKQNSKNEGQQGITTKSPRRMSVQPRGLQVSQRRQGPSLNNALVPMLSWDSIDYELKSPSCLHGAHPQEQRTGVGSYFSLSIPAC